VRTRLAALIGPALIGVAALTMLVGLAGCGSDLGPDIHPGSAAVVGDQDVTFAEVDDFADALCDWQEPEIEKAGSPLPMSYVKAVAMDSIVDDLLTHQFAEEKGLEPASGYKEAIAQVKSQVAESKFSRKIGDTVLEFRGREIYHQGIMATAGLVDFAEKHEAADQSGAIARGEEVFAKWRKAADVSVDPRFGTVEGATFDYTAPDGSLSIKVSDLAKRAAAGQNDKEYVDSLPPAQRCGGGA
jgi:hypothetical protein